MIFSLGKSANDLTIVPEVCLCWRHGYFGAYYNKKIIGSFEYAFLLINVTETFYRPEIYSSLSFIGNLTLGAGEMAQQLRAQTTLLESLSSNPSNHMVVHNHL